MKRIIKELEKPIYRYSIVDNEVVVDKFTKYYVSMYNIQENGLPIEAYDDNMIKRVSLPSKYRDRIFDTFVPQGGCMISFESDKIEEYKRLAREYYQGQIKKQEKALDQLKEKVKLLEG